MKESPSSSRKNRLLRKRPRPRWRKLGKKGRFRLSLPSQSIREMSLPTKSSRRWSLKHTATVTK